MNLLFICTKNQLRSLTAEQIFKHHPQHSVRSAGTAANARRQVHGTDINWAERIFVMEKKHQEILHHRFPTQTSTKQIICLNIPDEYQYMDQELIDILKDSLQEYLGVK